MPSRAETIARLVTLAAPLGPLQSPEDADRERERWLASAPPELVELLLGLVADPPPAVSLRGLPREDFELELEAALLHLAEVHPGTIVTRLGELVADTVARPVAIETIGGIGDAEGARWLAPLVRDWSQLSEDELVRLASALGEIATADTRDLLQALRANVPLDLGRVHREIDIALQVT